MISSAALTAREIADGDALFRAMGDKHLTKAQRLEIAEMIKGILDRAAAR